MSRKRHKPERFGGSFHQKSATEHTFPLTENQPRSRVSGVDQAYLGNIGSDAPRDDPRFLFWPR